MMREAGYDGDDFDNRSLENFIQTYPKASQVDLRQAYLQRRKEVLESLQAAEHWLGFI